MIRMSLFNLEKIFPTLFNNSLFTIILVIAGIAVVFYFVRKGEVKKDMKVFYFAEVERLVQPLDVNNLTPKSVETKDEKRFMRRAKSWLWKYKTTTFIVWLAKVGKGITYKLETNKRDDAGNVQVEKIGSLLDGIRNCLQLKDEDVIDNDTFDEAAINKLNMSEIFVCVDLELDDSTMPKITEESSTTEADRSMSDLVGLKIKQHLSKEDWIRNAGLMGLGALGYVIVQQLGLL